MSTWSTPTSTAWLKFLSGCGILMRAGTRPLDPLFHRKRKSYGWPTPTSGHPLTPTTPVSGGPAPPALLSASAGTSGAHRGRGWCWPTQRRVGPGACLFAADRAQVASALGRSRSSTRRRRASSARSACAGRNRPGRCATFRHAGLLYRRTDRPDHQPGLYATARGRSPRRRLDAA
jgi:hypothetical protein